MFVKQYVVEGLGNSSYLLVSDKHKMAAVIDPDRDVSGYLADAEKLGVAITHSLETHLHADFVSGGRELAARTGAAIVASKAAGLAFEHLPVAEGDVISLGDLTIGVLETPGHTPEHISFTVTSEGESEPTASFTGGALMVGGAARTDLIHDDMTEPLARSLYSTIQCKLLSLADSVTVYPTHGAGSFCAVPAGGERTTTIGQERKSNPFALAKSEEEFVRLALDGLPSYPVYFRRLRPINQRGSAVLGYLPLLTALPPHEFDRSIRQGALAADVRSPTSFARGHVPGAFNITLRDVFATWLGWLLPAERPLAFVTEGPEEHEELVRQALRIAYDRLAGYLAGGMEAWEAAELPVARSGIVTPQEVASWGHDGQPLVLDVRQLGEWQAGHIPDAVHIELGELEARATELPRGRPIVAHCGHGERSSSAISILQRLGFSDLYNLDGGTEAWRAVGLSFTR